MASFRLGLALATISLLLTVPFIQSAMGETPRASSSLDPEEYSTYIVLVSPPADAEAMSRSAHRHRRWHETFLPSRLTQSGDERLLCSYSSIFNGFAARLTEAELAAVAKRPGFLRALPDGKREVLTTRTPSYLGLSKDEHRLWSDAGYGRGVIIGILDTGIDGNHLSFRDDGVPDPPARWNGTCGGSKCNRKLLATKSFVRNQGPEDDAAVGHGTHVAGIAAGNFVESASLPGGLGSGTAAGIAPLTHIASYKVCSASSDGCRESSITCGMEEAVHDGVDIINLSFGWRTVKDKKPVRFELDPIAIGAFKAMAKGIVVVSSAGNSGPAPSTVINDAPWLLTVGAGSVDRRFDAEVEYEPTIVPAETLFHDPDSDSRLHPLIFTDESGKDTCEDVVYMAVADKIVICKAAQKQAGIISNLRFLGAAGVLLIDHQVNGYTTALSDYNGYKVIQVNSFAGRALTDYAKTLTPSARVSVNGVVLGAQHSPTVASFSSRGPSQNSRGLMKPDILAPGLNIIAASASPVGSTDSWSSKFKVMSGTSMAAPHITGVAALLKSAHPDWSPAAIKSAILTTADPLDNGGGPILDEQHDETASFAMGAGHVNASMATDPGLVYDLSASLYGAYICGQFGENALQSITGDPNSTCSEVGSIPEPWLNYPTITVLLNGTAITVFRTLTNVGPAETYTATTHAPSTMDIRVYPDTLVFSTPGEQKTFTVTVSATAGGSIGEGGDSFAEGSLIWVSNTHRVRSPVVALISTPDHGL